MVCDGKKKFGKTQQWKWRHQWTKTTATKLQLLHRNACQKHWPHTTFTIQSSNFAYSICLLTEKYTICMKEKWFFSLSFRFEGQVHGRIKQMKMKCVFLKEHSHVYKKKKETTSATYVQLILTCVVSTKKPVTHVLPYPVSKKSIKLLFSFIPATNNQENPW